MKTYYDCIPCFIRQALDALREVNSNQVIIDRSLRRILREASNFDLNLSPPEMGQIIHRIIREETGNNDPYKAIKDRSITMAKKIELSIRDRILACFDPFGMAVRFAIAGNIMDFALASAWNNDKINDSFNKAKKQSLNTKTVQKLKSSIENANTVLVLADNAGETVFDRILIDYFPGKATVTYAVKGGPIINDAVLEDAEASGLKEVAILIDNGNDAPGTILNKCSGSFKQVYNDADVVIAKGQANFETLNTADREIYFLTQIKCPVIAEHYNYVLGDWVVTSTSELSETKNRE
jgi:damage-control phosphatase, subfamily I